MHMLNQVCPPHLKKARLFLRDVLHLIRQHNPPRRVAGLPLPPGGERRLHVEAREGMRLGVEDDLVEGKEVIWREEEVEVL